MSYQIYAYTAVSSNPHKPVNLIATTYRSNDNYFAFEICSAHALMTTVRFTS